MDLNIQPDFGPLGFNNVDICLVNVSNAARGSLSIWRDLVRDEHDFFSGGGKASLPGKLRYQLPDAVKSPGV